ncbi:hypothetical protein M9Y10_020206 [Tritrichomonas musculus]|uniref:Protein kinase domain-containing protein n=1 Tax=Tritrichomonas musculus TaxID=1915356 RepID=A0ABR2HFI8_9EUKA
MYSAKTENGYLIRIPKTFRCYTCLSTLGCGSTSIVVKVEDKNTGKYYSAKIISVTDIENRKLMDAIQKEIAILQEVDHSNIIKLRESFEIQNRYDEEFIVMILEYCDLGDLLTLVTKHKIKNENQIKTIILGFLDAIRYLHSRGISHGDIKSENILLNKNNVAKLCDFGYCRTTFIAGNESKNGTLYYAAPELFRRGEFDPLKSDIYAVGITLYSLFELTFPFKDGDQHYITKQIVNNNLSFRIGMNKKLKELVIKCTDKDPKNRPTIEEIINDDYFNFGGKKNITKNNNLAQINLLIEKTKKNTNQSFSSSSNQEKYEYEPKIPETYESNLKF